MAKARRGKGRFKPGDPEANVRSSYLGYDCYLAGPKDHPTGYTTCKLRPNRLPESVGDEQRMVLPMELRWPFRDHACAHEMITAVLERDTAQMEAWKQLYDNWLFGFEDYIGWCHDQAEGERTGILSRPTGEPSHRDLIARIPGPQKAYWIDVHILRYPHGDAWGQVTVHARGSILTRYLVQLESGRETVVEHNPGRWAGLGFGPQGGLSAVRQIRQLVRPKGAAALVSAS